MLLGLAESAVALPFIKLPGASLVSSDPVDFGGVVGTFLPLNVRRWEHPERNQPFLNRSGCIRLGDLTLLSTWGSAIVGEVEQKCEAQLVLPYVAGLNSFTIERQTYTFRSSCLFIPAAGSRIELQCSLCSGVIISFPLKACCRWPMPSPVPVLIPSAFASPWSSRPSSAGGTIPAGIGCTTS